MKGLKQHLWEESVTRSGSRKCDIGVTLGLRPGGNLPPIHVGQV